ncbi:hypothetical protein OEA41_004707 [Lepraria neglecta]|uniref:Uncharacterized protein n=1 Tax=Lepraria neglecta TaxID=209136 RepID=A0AAD9YZN6_9LECA|nr:hypothetical protein OEA41_004707 [Lepraria neglecta]
MTASTPADAPCAVDEQPKPQEPMTVSLRGGGEKEDVCCGITSTTTATANVIANTDGPPKTVAADSSSIIPRDEDTKTDGAGA